MKKLKIGIDIDNTINVNAQTILFFKLITQALSGNKNEVEIHIITNRDPREHSRLETIAELEEYNIDYDKLAITANKHDYIMDNGINVFIDDTDEYYLDLPESVIVFKIREPGNFDFVHKKWVYGNKTGINIDKK